MGQAVREGGRQTDREGWRVVPGVEMNPFPQQEEEEGKGLSTRFVPAYVSAVLDGMKDSWR